MTKLSEPLLDDNGQVIINPKNGRPYCAKHINHTIHKYHEKCHLCRLEDGDIEKCEDCGRDHETNWDKCECGACKAPNFSECYKCGYNPQPIKKEPEEELNLDDIPF